MKHIPLVLLIVAAVALVAGCQPGQTDTGQTLIEQRAASSPAAPAERTISPPNEYRRRLTREAMRGLRYDSGRVEIDREAAAELVQGQDVQAAQSEYERGQAALRRNALNESLRAHTRAVE